MLFQKFQFLKKKDLRENRVIVTSYYCILFIPFMITRATVGI